MPPKFGTSGLRGLVTELIPDLVGEYVKAFVASCPIGTGLFIGYDLRPSSPMIAQTVATAARDMGLQVTDCGALPTPALALAAMQDSAAAVMVTGSHIPADRNGLKFYTPAGEITKDHEVAILGAMGDHKTRPGAPAVITNTAALPAYAKRYLSAYQAALRGRRIGLYAHSAVGRDILMDILQGLGAEVIELGRSGVFIPVDTEAVDQDIRHQLKEWAKAHSLDAIVSTDGDSDRPLLTDETGTVVVGDILGQITAQSLGAETVVTPVSSNTGAEAGGAFTQVIRTKIGSPYVIAAMEGATGRVVGYEANGGFLLGFDAQGPSGPLHALMTRDALLPIIATLVQAAGRSVSGLVAQQPPRFTASDRLQDVPTEWSQAMLQQMNADDAARSAFLQTFGSTEQSVDRTDGLRMTLADGRIVHLRPSGNAPELRVYFEASRAEDAETGLATGLRQVQAMLP